MAKDKITEYDATAANNTVVGDVNLAENSCLPSDLNNAVREVMSHQKEAFGSGTPLYVDQTNNNVGVNTTAVAADLEVGASASKINALTVKTATGSGGVAGISFMAGQTTAGREKAAMFFKETNGGAHYTGDLVFAIATSSGSAAQVAESDEVCRITSGGLAIGGTGAANTLDDYEEGNFTVTVSSGISVSSYDHQLGHYVKIGRQVTAWVFAEWNGSSRTGAHFIIDGLPFDSSDSTGDEATFGGFITYQNGFSGDYNIPHVPRGVNEIRFYQRDGSTLIGSELSGASGEVRVVVQYTVP